MYPGTSAAGAGTGAGAGTRLRPTGPWHCAPGLKRASDHVRPQASADGPALTLDVTTAKRDLARASDAPKPCHARPGAGTGGVCRPKGSPKRGLSSASLAGGHALFPSQPERPTSLL